MYTSYLQNSIILTHVREESFVSQWTNNRNSKDPKKHIKGISRKQEVFHFLGILWVLWRKNVSGVPFRGLSLSLWQTFSFVLLLWQSIIITSLHAEVKPWTLVHYVCASLESYLLISILSSVIFNFVQEINLNSGTPNQLNVRLRKKGSRIEWNWCSQKSSIDTSAGVLFGMSISFLLLPYFL